MLPCRTRLGTFCSTSRSSRSICSPHVTSAPPPLFLTNFESENKKSKHSLKVQRYANHYCLDRIFSPLESRLYKWTCEKPKPWSWAAAFLQRTVSRERHAPAPTGPWLPSQTGSSLSVAPARSRAGPWQHSPSPRFCCTGFIFLCLTHFCRAVTEQSPTLTLGIPLLFCFLLP